VRATTLLLMVALTALNVSAGARLVIDLLRSRHFSAPAILITSDPSPSVRARAGKASVPIVEKPLLGNALLQKIRDMAGDGRS